MLGKYTWLDEYFLNKKGATKDYKVEWEATRYLVGGKMFCMVGDNGKGMQIITLKCEPDFGHLLRKQYSDIYPGHYMNKEHWNSIDISGDVPDDVVRQMADSSYNLVFGGLTKKLQKEILEQ